MTVLRVFLLSLSLTLALEFLVALVFKLRGRDLLLFLLVNLLTNPAAVYLNLLFTGLFPGLSVFVWQIPIELAVVAVEGLIYKNCSCSMRAPWAFAVAANVFSYGIGLIINLII